MAGPKTKQPSKASSRKRRLIGADIDRCIYCERLGITRQGKRYKKMEVVQL